MVRYISPHRACLQQSKMHHKAADDDNKIKARQLCLKHLLVRVIFTQRQRSSSHYYEVITLVFSTQWNQNRHTKDLIEHTAALSSATLPSQFLTYSQRRSHYFKPNVSKFFLKSVQAKHIHPDMLRYCSR
jgi:hypothetical protein